MTVASTANVKEYTGTGANTPLSTVFPFIAATDIVVTQRITATGASTVLVQGTHYNVTGGGSPPVVGTVTPINGAVDFTSAMTWTLSRNTAKTQPIDYVENDQFPAESHEAGLDRVTLIAQDSSVDRTDGVTTQSRALVIPASDPLSVNTEIPDAVDRAGKALVFDGSGQPSVQALTTSDSTNSIVVATDSSASRTLAERFAQTINVKDYGALGDGSTDDTVAIAAAAAIAMTSGKSNVLYFPAGTYRVTEINLSTAGATLRIVGDGAGSSTIKLVDDANPPTVSAMLYVNRSNVIVEDLTLDGNSNFGGLTNEDVDVVKFTGNGFTMRSCFVINASRDGISDDQSAIQSTVEIDGCQIRSSGRFGVIMSSDNKVRVSNCLIEGTGNVSLTVSSSALVGAVELAVIADNIINRDPALSFRLHSSLGGALAGDCIISSVDQMIVRNNLLRLPPHGGISIGNDSFTITDVVVSGNLIDRANDLNTLPDVAGILLFAGPSGGGLDGVTVTGNHVRDTRGTPRLDHGIRVVADTFDVSQLLIDSNMLEDVVSNSIDVVTSSGGTLTEFVLGSGNKLKKDQLYGVGTLSMGALTADAVGLPDALAMYAVAHRIDPNTGTSTALGSLVSIYDTANSQTNISSRSDGTPTLVVTGDASIVFWRILGTQDAF